jgi:hypothetical protein
VRGSCLPPGAHRAPHLPQGRKNATGIWLSHRDYRRLAGCDWVHRPKWPSGSPTKVGERSWQASPSLYPDVGVPIGDTQPRQHTPGRRRRSDTSNPHRRGGLSDEPAATPALSRGLLPLSGRGLTAPPGQRGMSAHPATDRLAAHPHGRPSPPVAAVAAPAVWALTTTLGRRSPAPLSGPACTTPTASPGLFPVGRDTPKPSPATARISLDPETLLNGPEAIQTNITH